MVLVHDLFPPSKRHCDENAAGIVESRGRATDGCIATVGG